MKKEIKRNVCYFARKYLNIGYPGCEFYSIWDFPSPSTVLQDLWDGYTNAIGGLLFWCLFGVSVLELLYACTQFITLLTMQDLSEINWPQTSWVALSERTLHRCWLAKSLIMIIASNFLLSAFVWGMPELLYPWEVIYGTILFIDVFFLARSRWETPFGIFTAYLLPLFKIYWMNSLWTYTEEVVDDKSEYSFTELLKIPPFLMRLIR